MNERSQSTAAARERAVLVGTERARMLVPAAESLADKAGEDKTLFGRLFERVKELTGEAMVMGLIRSQSAEAHTLLGEGAKMPTDTAARLSRNGHRSRSPATNSFASASASAT